MATNNAKNPAGTFRVRLVRGFSGHDLRQRRTCLALGLKKINAERVVQDTPANRGLAAAVPHMVRVVED